MRGLERRGCEPLRFLNAAFDNWDGSESLTTFSLREITELETLKFIQKLSNSTAFGRDKLDGLSMKVAAGHLKGPITHLINVSIRTSQFTSKWKLSRLIPILKSKDLSGLTPSSYRPVALLPVVSKIIERAVQMQLQEHMERHDLFNEHSHAYRQNLSTATAILQLMDELYRATDDGQISQLLAIDQSAAFDCVSHQILLRKLTKYGCSTGTISWMRNYLSHRTQYTSIGRHKSHMVATDRGVPQGSILGPLLYLIYTNEIGETVKDKDCKDLTHLDRTKLFGSNCGRCGLIVNYADDLTYHVANRSRNMNQQKISENLTILKDFLNDNELVINAGKTATLELMTKQKKGRTGGEPPHIVVRTETGELKHINDCKQMRLLGTNLQQNLGWRAYLESGRKAILPTIRKQFGAIKILGKMLPRGSKKLLAEGLLMSKMIYIITQWGGAGHSQITAVQRLQNQIARWITGQRRRVRISTLLEEVGWWSIREQIRIHSLVQLWKVLHLNKPATIRNKLRMDDEGEIHLPPPRLQFTLLGFTWRSVEYWNELPQEIRTLKSLPKFKRSIKKWTMDRRNIDPDG